MFRLGTVERMKVVVGKGTGVEKDLEVMEVVDGVEVEVEVMDTI